jgi:hypothetical protein
MIEHLRISRAERRSVPVVLDAVTDVNAWFQPGPNDFVGLDVDSDEESLSPVKALDLARRNFQSGALEAVDDQILVLREQQDYVVEIEAWGKEFKVHSIPEIWRMSWNPSSIFTYGSPDQISATKLDLHIQFVLPVRWPCHPPHSIIKRTEVDISKGTDADISKGTDVDVVDLPKLERWNRQLYDLPSVLTALNSVAVPPLHFPSQIEPPKFPRVSARRRTRRFANFIFEMTVSRAQVVVRNSTNLNQSLPKQLAQESSAAEHLDETQAAPHFCHRIG